MGRLENRFAQISILQISDTYFMVDDSKYIADGDKSIKIVLKPNFVIERQSRKVDITIRVFMHYEDQSSDAPLADLLVKNLFEFKSLEKYVEKGKVILSAEIMIVLLSISLSHARALMAKNLSQTNFAEVILPVLDVRQIAALFFPREMKKSEPPEKKSKKKLKNTAKNKEA